MTAPVNIYTLSRIREEATFNIVNQHHARAHTGHNSKYHEMESLKLLADRLWMDGVSVAHMDGFFWGFIIPQIGKEFDLLKLTDKVCLNIELKSAPVSTEDIRTQLRKNRYYLSYLGRRCHLFTVVTDTMTCYRLSVSDTLVQVDFGELLQAVQAVSDEYCTDIDGLFKPSEFLVSPLSTPQKFIQGYYFLTQQQEYYKKQILELLDSKKDMRFYHLTGRPGTGKTLLLYDLAKVLSQNGKTLLIHCGVLSEGHAVIQSSIHNLQVISSAQLTDTTELAGYDFLLVDESHRMEPALFERLCRNVTDSRQICIFSSDPGQVLSDTEKIANIAGRIHLLDAMTEFVLSEKIRSNHEMHTFISCLCNLHHKVNGKLDYAGVQLNYANTSKEAQEILQYYRDNGYVFINYSRPHYVNSPYADYSEDFDTHHVIGQEFDNVVMLMDDSFSYSENGRLQGIPHPNPNYLYPNLFYQGVTRVREKLSIIVVNNAVLFAKICRIVE